MFLGMLGSKVQLVCSNEPDMYGSCAGLPETEFCGDWCVFVGRNVVNV